MTGAAKLWNDVKNLERAANKMAEKLGEFGDECYPTSTTIADAKYLELLGQVNSDGYVGAPLGDAPNRESQFFF